MRSRRQPSPSDRAFPPTSRIDHMGGLPVRSLTGSRVRCSVCDHSFAAHAAHEYLAVERGDDTGDLGRCVRMGNAATDRAARPDGGVPDERQRLGEQGDTRSHHRRTFRDPFAHGFSLV